MKRGKGESGGDQRGERLQKVLAKAGVASRRQSEKLITSGKVSVNGEVIRELGTRVLPTDEVRLEGRLVAAEAHRYYLLHKPRGMVTTLSDPEGRPCVGQLVKELPVRVFPVGRLDFDGEGLLLLTNDGELAERAMHPRFHVPRVYEVKVKGVPDDAALERLLAGVRLEDGRAKALEASLLRRTRNNTWIRVVVAEGRQHLVKRLCAAVGHPVQRLRRVQVGELLLGDLRSGEIREIGQAQAKMAALENSAGPSDREPSPRPPGRRPPARSGPGRPAPRGKKGDKGGVSQLLILVGLLSLGALSSGCADDVVTSSKKLSEDSSSLIRADAALRLGELGGAEALRVLTAKGLHDESPRVREASIRALEKQNHPRLIDLFGDLLFDPAPEVQLAAAHALATRGDDRARRTLELAYGRAPVGSRLAIAAALTAAGVEPERAIAGWSESQLNSLLAAVRSDSVAERMGAAEQLGRSGRPEAVAALLPMLADRSVGVAASAARGLGWAGEPRAVSLLSALLNESYPSLRRDAAIALERIGSASALPALAGAVPSVDDPTAVVYVHAIRALADGPRVTPEEGAKALCQALIEAPGPRSATLAARAIDAAEIDCQAAEALSARLSGRDANLHATLAAIEELRGAGLDERQLAKVSALLEEDDLRVAGEALAALAAADPVAWRERSRRTLTELLEGQHRAREEWVPGTLPTREDWAVPEEVRNAALEDEGEMEDAYSLMGMDTGNAYRKRFDELVTRVAELRATHEAEAASRKGLGPVDLAVATRENLEALKGDVASTRVELVDDRPPELEARLAAACRAVGWSGESAADADDLIEAMRTNGLEVQQAAASALGRLGPAFAPKVLEILANVQTAEVMIPLARVLDAARVPRSELVRRIPAVAETARGPLLHLLAVRGGPGAEALLIEELSSAVTAPAAATALGRLGTPSALTALEELVRSGSTRGRLEAFRALGVRGPTPERAEALAHGLHDHSAEVRAAAAAALAGRQGPSRVWVEALKKDYDVIVRRALEGGAQGSSEEESNP